MWRIQGRYHDIDPLEFMCECEFECVLDALAHSRKFNAIAYSVQCIYVKGEK